ncbi:penicillin-binding protein 2 [Natronospora cellulosivora (SeqCode)]
MDKRISIFKIIIVLVFLFLILRAGQLQIIRGDYYYQLSEGNRMSQRPVLAPRGRILDNDYNVLVSNREAYSIYLLPNEVPPEYTIDELISRLASLSSYDEETLMNNYNRGRGHRSNAVLLKRNISRQTMVIVEENIDELPGIMTNISSMREYVYGEFAPHILGYVGEINRDELIRFNETGVNYRGGDVVGKTGLERFYEPYLRGTNGIEQIEVNSRGIMARTLATLPPEPGNDLVLNINVDLQQYVETLLEEELYRLRNVASEDDELFPPTGAVAIAMDPKTGAILAMASVPGYDLNLFVEGISHQDFADLNNNPLRPLYNRPIMNEVNPGSVFKLVTGAAAIEELGVTADTSFVDNTGIYRIGEFEYRNWYRWGGEGELNFTRAIARSNNVVFYQLGHELYNLDRANRGDNLAQAAREFGFGAKTGVDLPNERVGIVTDNEWKLRTHGEIWYPGDAVQLAIGQRLTTTPLQVINMMSAIANGGYLYRPRLVDKIIDHNGEIIVDFEPEVIRELPFEQSTYDILIEGLRETTRESYGTASRHFMDFPVEVVGKTGTAQTRAAGANHGWFAGFAPIEDPDLAVLVFLEEGNSSAYTLPIAADIFRKYYEVEEDIELEIELDIELDN